jgi:ubiquinone/menaquinone biosynthesis C-methylase UbiE
MDSKFWDKVYSNKSESQVSWFQEVPNKSIEMIEELNLPLESSVIDVGGGESRLTDYFLAAGFKNITVLDISEVSLNKLKHRLHLQGSNVNFIVQDILTYQPSSLFKLWHDRATFHFLTSTGQIESYLKCAYDALEHGGHLIVSTFSKQGPDKCSGLTVSKYSDSELKELFGKYFQNVRCIEDVHLTPWGTTQNFVYCGFKKI